MKNLILSITLTLLCYTAFAKNSIVSHSLIKKSIQIKDYSKNKLIYLLKNKKKLRILSCTATGEAYACLVTLECSDGSTRNYIASGIVWYLDCGPFLQFLETAWTTDEDFDPINGEC